MTSREKFPCKRLSRDSFFFPLHSRGKTIAISFEQNRIVVINDGAK